MLRMQVMAGTGHSSRAPEEPRQVVAPGIVVRKSFSDSRSFSSMPIPHYSSHHDDSDD